jgi:NAD(P)-dependent dehydrogenase (short-subunit alcohol dehydrogenase family)
MDLELGGKVAVVTGASKGIGLAVVRTLAAEGAAVVAGARTVDALAGLDGVTALEVDLAQPGGPEALVAQRERYGLERARARPARFRPARQAQMVRTLAAFGPLGPCSSSYSTFAPSVSDLKPLPAIALWWTNRSLSPSSGVMKP